MAWLPDAVEAALIAGGVSLAGLLIANQSRISGFRQEWINGLRDDVASLVAHALEIQSGKSPTKLGDESNPLFGKSHEVTARISLRLNPEEDESKAINKAMNDLRDVIHSPAGFDEVSLKANELIDATQAVL